MSHDKGLKAAPDVAKLKGALARVDNALLYEGLDDVFEIAVKYAESIAFSHAMSNADILYGLYSARLN